ncbi:unnamed protein product [Phytophthora fragariaefolia]|uniref:Unnamed protein product n=1 Tax=Phytophthora fragariaefolia TaxID=1490495 RepID=A0A9W7CXT8_9STRA|nr:unnamed protein product [Phytophthora fragariaefolia]
MEELRSLDRVARSARLPPNPAKTNTAYSSVSHSFKKAGLSQDPPYVSRRHSSRKTSSIELDKVASHDQIRSAYNSPQTRASVTTPSVSVARSSVMTASISRRSPTTCQPQHPEQMASERDPNSELAKRWRVVPKHNTRLESHPPILVMTRRQRRPDLWQFVQLVPNPACWFLSDEEFDNSNAIYAYCKKCGTSLTFSVGNHKATEHMTKYHSRELAEYGAAKKLQRRLKDDFAEVAVELRTITAEEQKEFNRLLAKWIASHFRPLVLVADKGFIEFIAFITETLTRVKVKIPKRHQLRGCVVEFAAELRIKVRDDIKQFCVYFSITSDIWSARNARSYIAFPIHYVTVDFHPRNWTLEVKELPGIHTGEVIAEALDEIMQDWEFQKEYCTRFIRDYGSNIVKAGKIMAIYHAPCMAHEIHLVLSGAMSSQKKSSQKSKPAWASIIENEPGAAATEHEIDDDLIEDERADMETIRDNAVLELADFYRHDFGCPRKGWHAIQAGDRANFPHIGCLGGQTYPTLPLVMPAIDALEDVMNDSQLFDGILNSAGGEAYIDEVRVAMKDCQAVIKRLFDTRFADVKSTDLYWITYLDPRVASEMNHLTPETEESARTQLLAAAAEFAPEQATSANNAAPPGTTKKALDRVTSRMFGKKKRAAVPANRACVREFNEYLAAVRLLDAAEDTKFNAFDWWRVNKGSYPILSKLARKWLGAVATSVPSERGFSTSGNIITTKRSSLTPDLVRDLVFIAENTHRMKPLRCESGSVSDTILVQEDQ